MNYQEAVAEFRHLDDSVEAAQWRQAQLTWENASPIEGDGKHSLTRWSENVGKGRKHVSYLYSIWSRWGSAADFRPPFTEAYRMAETSTETPEEASAIKDANRAASALGKLPAKSRAQVIREHFTDPDVVKEVMQDPAARSHATEAIDRHRTQRDHQEHDELTRDRPEPDADPFEVLAKFRYLHRTLTDIAELIARRGGVSGEARDALLEECDWLANALTMIRDGVRGGNVDAAIDAILTEAGE